MKSTVAFMDTAAIMMNLDLVICSDSSVAHLAGALGRPRLGRPFLFARLALAARSRRQPVVSDDAAVSAEDERVIGRECLKKSKWR